MIHIIGHVLFALGLLKWLTWELKKPFEPTKHSIWLVLTVFGAILGLLLSNLSTSGHGIGNFLLHAIGGGVASTCTFEYLRRHIGLRVSWRVEVLLLFLFVSGFGVLNELLEYLAELLGYGIFSLDSQDTWRDFVANTSGSLVTYILIKLTRHIVQTKK